MVLPFTRLLVAYDGSPPAAAALRCANAVAVHGAQVVVADVMDLTPVSAPELSLIGHNEAPGLEALRRESEALLDAARAACLAAGIEPTVRLMQGHPANELTSLARELEADLIVTGTHGRRGFERAVLGSTAEGILRATTVPVMVVREDTRLLSIDKPFERLLVAIDNSGPADAALALAARMAEAYGSIVLCCSVADTRDAQAKSVLYGYDPLPLKQSLREDALHLIRSALAVAGLPEEPAKMLVSEGEPSAGIIETAKYYGVAAIVIGTHGRRGLERFFLGSIAEKIARESPLPVIVTRSPAAMRTMSRSVPP
jgi:nucleotide-binding universal stress UspA family protein